LLAQKGYTSAQLVHFHLPATDAAFRAQLRAAFVEQRITLHALLIDDGDITHPEHGPAHADWIRSWFPIAADLGAQHVRIIAGKQPASSATRAASIAMLNTLADDAKQQRVGVLIENWFSTAATPADVHTILDGCQRVQLNIDFGNWKGPDKYDALASIARRAVSCHAKPDFKAALTPEPQDYTRCLDILDAAGFSGPYLLIYEDASSDDEWAALDAIAALTAPRIKNT
jgi:sugar phosphate isomerase/epimerase